MGLQNIQRFLVRLPDEVRLLWRLRRVMGTSGIDPTTLLRELKLFGLLLNAQRLIPPKESVFYQSFREGSMKVFDRTDYLVELVKGKRVLHIGFIDKPFLEEKLQTNQLLHARLRETAKFLHGVDIDAKGVERYRQLTGDYENSAVDVLAASTSLDSYRDKFDIILMPEVLEHVINPGEALSNLHRLCQINNGCQLCLTVPNALSLVVFAAATHGVEFVHPDHYFYFSPHTVGKILHDSGFSQVSIALYVYPGLRMPGLTNNGVIALASI